MKYVRCLFLGIIFTLVNCGNTIIAQPFGGFIDFDGVDDEFMVLGQAIPNNSDFTIEFWFKICDDTSSSIRVFFGNSNRLEVNLFKIDFDTVVYQHCGMTTNNYVACYQNHQHRRDSSWHHIAVTYTKAVEDFEMYYDGSTSGTLMTHTYNFSSYPIMKIGAGNWQLYNQKKFKGYLDEFRISNTVRYNGSFSPPNFEFTPDSLTHALWHFNEQNPILMINDDSGNDFDLAPSGNPKSINLTSLVIQENSILTTIDSLTSYQWIDCLTNTPIIGATNKDYTPTANGSYAVEVANGNCPVRSECFIYNALNLEGNDVANIDVYPNPVVDFLFISQLTNDDLYIELRSLNAELIIKETSSLTATRLDLNWINPGIYYLKIINKDNVSVRKIVKS